MIYDHVFETPASSQTKNGVPTMAVRIPSGISIAAAVRATVSITSRNPPPSSAAVGISRPKSGPTDWGMGDETGQLERAGPDSGDFHVDKDWYAGVDDRC